MERANAIAQEYLNDDVKLTLRQLYYQFVARGLLPNGQEVYKRIGDVLTEARYSGLFAVDSLEDLGRHLTDGDRREQLLSAADALEEAERYLEAVFYQQIRVARWFGQPTHVSVWVEKEALSGIFAPVCEDLAVPFMACKGYPSVSALSNWLDQTRQDIRASDRGSVKQIEVLYFGDHDPDGFGIPRAAEESLRKLRILHEAKARDFVAGEGISLEDYADSEGMDPEDFLEDEELPPVQFRRIALTMSQIRKYNPPPFPAKETSARFARYLREQQTTDAWELDALEPRVLRDLIRSEVNSRFDEGVYRHQQRDVKEARKKLVDEKMTSDWFENWRTKTRARWS